MKPLTITLFVCLYFFASIAYMLLCPDAPKESKPSSYVWLRCFYFILQYSCIFFLSLALYKEVTHSVDLLSLLFMMIYSVGKLIYFVFLINKDLPTYIDFLNSKVTSLIYSILLLCLTVSIKLIKK
jgi:hypothetical protein